MARERKLYQKQRARKGAGRSKNRPVQVSAELHDELSIIKDAYSKCLGKPVTFEQMLRRWIDRLPRIDGDVFEEYQLIRETRLTTEAAAVTTARGAMSEIYKRMRTNGSSVVQEALKEIETAEEHLMEDLAAAAGAGDQESPEPVATPLPQEEGKKTEKRFVHPDGRSYKAVPGDRVNWVPVDEKGNWLQMKTVKGFVLKDVEV